MNINYSQFKYDDQGTWFGNAMITIEGIVSEVLVRINSREDKFIPVELKLIYEWYLENSQSIYHEMLDKILEYYCNERDELGYVEDGEEDEDFPLVSDTKTIADMIKLKCIILPNRSKNEKEVNFMFEASWDEEEGLGVRTVEGQVIEVDFEGIAFG